MTISQLVLLGDSLTKGAAVGAAYAEGGRGNWAQLVADRLANIPTLGPLLSSGFRHVEVAAEWAYTGSWTSVVSTDVFDRAPYGHAKYANGSSFVLTYTKPAVRAVVGFSIYWINYAAGGDWSYRIDGGAWTAMGQTLGGATANKLCKFYVASAFTSTVEIRAANAGGTGVGCLPVGIELFYSDPTVATQGLIVHNLGVNGEQLHNLVLVTSGDRMAFLDQVQLGTGSPITNQPNVGVICMHINDVTINNTTTFATDLTTLNTRAQPLGIVGLMNPWECGLPVGETVQKNYRAQLKTSAAGFSPAAKVFDHYDNLAANGIGPVVAVSIGDVIAAGSDGVLSSSLTGAQPLHLSDASSFPAAGWTDISANSEHVTIKYSGKNSTDLLNCLTITGSSAFSASNNVQADQNGLITDGGPYARTVDGLHLDQTGHIDRAVPIYWWIRNTILGLGAVPSTYVVSAKQAAVQYTAKAAAVQYSAGAPISV